MARGFAQGAGAAGGCACAPCRTCAGWRWPASRRLCSWSISRWAIPCPFSIAPLPSRSARALNVVLALRYPPSHRLTNREATFYLAFDVLQLAALLYLTGGIANPFALMFVAPVVIAAATLNLGNVLILAGIAFASVSVIAIVHRPLPWPRRRSVAAAAAVSGRHLDGAGDRHRLHLGLCLAHRLGIGAHVGGPGRDPARLVARASPGGAGRAGHRGGA